MGPEIFAESKTAIFLIGLYGRSRSVIADFVKNSRVADLSSDIKRSFLNNAVKSASILIFMAVSVNILLSAMVYKDICPLDVIIKGALLFISLGGFFCNANWKDASKSSVILSKIFK